MTDEIPKNRRSVLVPLLAAAAFVAIFIATMIGVVRYFVFNQPTIVLRDAAPAKAPEAKTPPTMPGRRAYDVTATLQKLVKNNSLAVRPRNDIFGGDPAPLVSKSLRVRYSIDGANGMVTAQEGAQLEIAAAPGKKLVIEKAVYGVMVSRLDHRPPGDIAKTDLTRSMDVTEILAKAVTHDTLIISAGNDKMGGDPALGLPKRLIVKYTVSGKPHTASADEGETLKIPTIADGEGPIFIVKATWGAPN